MLRGTEIVYIKFVLKFFKIKNAYRGLCFEALARSSLWNYDVNASGCREVWLPESRSSGGKAIVLHQIVAVGHVQHLVKTAQPDQCLGWLYLHIFKRLDSAHICLPVKGMVRLSLGNRVLQHVLNCVVLTSKSPMMKFTPVTREDLFEMYMGRPLDRFSVSAWEMNSSETLLGQSRRPN